MMKKLTGLLLLTLILSVQAVVAQTRQLTNFHGLAIGGSIEAIVTIGDQEHIRLEGDREAIAALITEVKNGVLSIRPKTKWTEWNKKFRNSRIRAYITAKRINSLAINGSGDIDVQNVINASELAVAVSGSGSISMNVNVKELVAAISGSGNIDMKGKATNVSASIDGSGNMNGRDLSVSELAAQISGSGNMYFNASKTINASISGSGSVHYSGDPQVQKAVSGSGSVRRN